MSQTSPKWTILSNHGIVLFHIAANPHSTLRELSDLLGITERQIRRILKDLAAAEIIQIQREGRRNRYSINPNAHLRHPTLSPIPLQRFIAAMTPESGPRQSF
jgi:DNA-binding MarR family transcriptional regulator